MDAKAVTTVNRSPEEVQRLWQDPEYRSTYIDGLDAQVEFTPAPGDRGTEIHVTLSANPPGGKLGEAAEAKLKQRPAQPLSDNELETVGAR